jgi:CheY-like chemotaxis protein
MKPITLLLVEDHDDTRLAMQQWLATYGYAVLAAASAKESLELARTQPFDLLLCDVQLPDSDGWELINKLEAKQPFVALAMSGRCAPADLARSKAAGYFAHVIKPCGVEIESLLDSAQQELRRLRRRNRD